MVKALGSTLKSSEFKSHSYIDLACMSKFDANSVTRGGFSLKLTLIHSTYPIKYLHSIYFQLALSCPLSVSTVSVSTVSVSTVSVSTV